MIWDQTATLFVNLFVSGRSCLQVNPRTRQFLELQ